MPGAGGGPITDVFAPDMVWRIEGHSAASKEYSSEQQFIDEVLAPFGGRFTASEPFRPVRIRAIYADDDTVVVVWDGRGIANDGQPYENSYVVDHEACGRPGRRRRRVLRQHRVQRPLGPRPAPVRQPVQSARAAATGCHAQAAEPPPRDRH